MLRSSRASLALIRSLMLGTATVTTMVVASSVLVGCKDENQPEYWLEKLDDAKWRPKAVERLTQFLDDAMTKAQDDPGKDPTKAAEDKAAVKALQDKLVPPLTQVYVDSYDDLDTKTRVNLIKLLADFRDERAVPALKKAFDEFAKRPRETKDEQDIKWAIRAYGAMKSKELAPSVLAAFEALKAHTQLGGISYKDYSKGMVDAPSEGWEDALIAKLNEKIKHPNSGKTPQQKRDMIDPFRDEQFWQLTAAQVLGELKSTKAVEPLIKLILDPSKGDMAPTALLALVKIGKPAVDRAAKLLNESDPLVAFAKERMNEASGSTSKIEGNPALASAAAIIGMAGRADGIEPLIKVLDTKMEDADKALIARELPKMPATDASKAAFKKAFESISLDATVQGTPALALLAESAAQYFDPTMVDWMLERAAQTQGGGEAKTALQQTLVTSALKVAKAAQWDAVSKAADEYKVSDLVKPAIPVVKDCGDKVDCYLAGVEKSEYQAQKDQLAGIKAAYMIGVLGDAKARDALLERLSSIENGAIYYVALSAIDKLSTSASPEVVAALEAIIEKNDKSGDPDKLSKNSPTKQVAYRISVR
jgi:hypothetical protein